jgi:hypothetical protein
MSECGDLLLNKQLLIDKMKQRQDALKILIDKDITGNTLAVLEAWREVKYWREAIERNEFDKLVGLKDD